MSEADLTPDQIARALAGLRRGAWTHHDVVDEREVMIDRTDDMARLAEAIERLTVERDTAISQATWANHAAECAEAAAGAMAEQRDEARLQAEYETDVAAAEIEGRKAAEARVTLLEAALREIVEGNVMDRAEPFRNDGVLSKNDRCRHGKPQWEGCEQCVVEFAAAALTAPPRSEQSAASPDDGAGDS